MESVSGLVCLLMEAPVIQVQGFLSSNQYYTWYDRYERLLTALVSVAVRLCGYHWEDGTYMNKSKSL
jgi:hypothetical protein